MNDLKKKNSTALKKIMLATILLSAHVPAMASANVQLSNDGVKMTVQKNTVKSVTQPAANCGCNNGNCACC